MKVTHQVVRSNPRRDRYIEVAAVAFLLFIAGCGGGSSTGGGSQSGDIQNDEDPIITGGQPLTLNTDPDFSFLVNAENAAVTGASADTFTGSSISAGDTQHQLLAGTEVRLENPELSDHQDGTLLKARFINDMPGIVVRSMSVVIESSEFDGVEFRYVGADFKESEQDDDFLLAGDGIDLALQLPAVAATDRLSVSVFADTAGHIVVGDDNAASAIGERVSARNTVVVHNFNDLNSRLDSAGAGAVVTFDLTDDDDDPGVVTVTEPLVLRNPVTIQGSLGNIITLESGLAGHNSMIYIESGVGPVELKWLNIIGARNYSAISNGGSLKLSGIFFTENRALNGGALLNFGTTTIARYSAAGRETQFVRNSATAGGGAIYNAGHLELRGGTYFGHNLAQANGGAILNHGGTVSVTRNSDAAFDTIEFSHNGAVNSHGGAIYNAAQSFLTLDRSGIVLTANHAIDGYGGAVFNQGTATFKWITFQDNVARAGGALQNESNESITIEYSEFLRNRARITGGAINSCGTTLVMRTTLVSLNTFEDDDTSRHGGGLNVYRSCSSSRDGEPRQTSDEGSRTLSDAPRDPFAGDQVQLEHVTLWNNSGVEGQNGTGIYLENGASLRIHNSIVAMNPGGNLFMSDVDAEDPSQVNFTSTNSFYSVMDKFALGSGDIASENPFDPLDPLISLTADGFPALSVRSRAVNAGDCTHLSSDAQDIRGENRPAGGSCDMGAYQLTEEELAADTTTSEKLLLIQDVRPDYANNPNDVELRLDKPLLEVEGMVDTEDLVDLRISVNYAGFEMHPNLSNVIAENGVFIFRSNGFLLDASALRHVADSRNRVTVEALYADGSVSTASHDFLVSYYCREQNNRHCDYTGGQIADVSVDYAGDFVWYETGNVAPEAFNLTLDYKAWSNLWVGCSAGAARPDCEFQNFSYRINDGEIVTLNDVELAAFKDDEGNYRITIPVSGLKPGLNGVVYGSLYADTWLRTDALHFEVQ